MLQLMECVCVCALQLFHHEWSWCVCLRSVLSTGGHVMWWFTQAHSLPPELELENYKWTLMLTNITDIRDVWSDLYIKHLCEHKLVWITLNVLRSSKLKLVKVCRALFRQRSCIPVCPETALIRDWRYGIFRKILIVIRESGNQY